MKEKRKKQFAVADTIQREDIKKLRARLNLTQGEFAALANVSKPTVERWESGSKPISGAIVTLCRILGENPEIADRLEILPKKYPLRIKYMCNGNICTIIDVDERFRRIQIYNYARDYLERAFGKTAEPTFEDYEEFLRSRCFPESRDKMKWVLEDLGIPFYDPVLIIEKTQGRMADDDFYLEIERS